MTLADPVLRPLLLLLALPLGLVLVRALPPARSRIARAGTATLAGLGVMTAIAHALLCLGVTARNATLAVAILGTATGTAILLLRRRAPRETSRPAPSRLVLEAAVLCVLALLLLRPAQHCRDFTMDAHDGIHIWAPKVVRAFDEAPPDLADHVTNAHPEYPRGFALLVASITRPNPAFDARLLRTVPLFLFALTLLAAFDALSARGNVAGGFVAMLLLAFVPGIVREATSGLADTTLAAFILLACIGLSGDANGRPALLVTLAGAAGALVIKDEGLAFCGLVVLVTTIRLVRARRIPHAVLATAALAVIALPWVLLRSRVHSGTPLLWQSIVENFGLTLLRLEQFVRETRYVAMGGPDPTPGGVDLPFLTPGGDAILHCAAIAAIVLVVGRGGRVVVLPACLLLLVDTLTIVASHVNMEWQIATAINRLVLQVLPVLLVAAVDKLTTESREAADAGARTPAPA